MDRPGTLHCDLVRGVEHVLAALSRVLLRHGMSFAAFEIIDKRIDVDVALSEFSSSGKKPSISRASILSGLTRKEVQRLVAEGRAESEAHRHDLIDTRTALCACSPGGRETPTLSMSKGRRARST